MTKVNFKALDKYVIKPVGVYGSKDEIVRFLLHLGAIDETMYIIQPGLLILCNIYALFLQCDTTSHRFRCPRTHATDPPFRLVHRHNTSANRELSSNICPILA